MVGQLHEQGHAGAAVIGADEWLMPLADILFLVGNGTRIVVGTENDPPGPLGMPLQGMLVSEAMSRVHRYPKPAQKVAFNPVGQIVGAMNEKLAVRDVLYTLVEEYVDAVDRLQQLQA